MQLIHVPCLQSDFIRCRFFFSLGMEQRMAAIIDGKAVAKEVQKQIKEEVEGLDRRWGWAPGLAVVLVGDDPASHIYVRSKEKACREVGIKSFEHLLPATIPEKELLALVHQLNKDNDVHGILVQLPLPPHIRAEKVLEAISPRKDIDGFHPMSQGMLLLGGDGFRPCTPLGIMKLLAAAGCDPKGKTAVVVGRSNIVGKPVALMLLEKHATVTICHSRTASLRDEVGRADILVVAIGKAGLVRGDWIKPGAVVIDVGVNRLASGRLTGDVEFDGAKERASAITPVPGGVGPMTICMLLYNTLKAAKNSLQRER
jgi:methylenetetrahydrofolate dehydrogenase (NADP+) / methenyltetrahydrofolate cyclohydrolase